MSVVTAGYERRVIAFYDILGWTNKVGWAGDQPERIGLLNKVLFSFSTLSARENESGISNASIFSDNVIASQKCGYDTEWFLIRVAFSQLLAARQNFWLRGGITIGDIVHDKDVVFGPGLNRAHEIEKDVAVEPRIVVDSEHLKEFEAVRELLTTEGDVTFLDPFSVRFFKKLAEVVPELFRAMSEPMLGPGCTPEFYGRLELGMMVQTLEDELRKNFVSRQSQKLLWLHEHIWRNLDEYDCSK